MNKNYNDLNIKNLIRKLFQAKIREEELNELNDWYDSFGYSEDMEIMSSISNNKNEIKQKIFDRINSKRKKTSRIYSIIYEYRNIAAAVLLFSLITAGITYYINNFGNKNTIEWNEVWVKDGQKRILTLPDNSKITVNSGSYLKYPKNFSTLKSEVYLEGEAYFEIMPDKKRNFIVHTSKVSTSVLGTKFNINAFESNDEISVALIEGSVKVNRDNENNSKVLFLRPMQQYVYSKKDTNEFVKSFIIQEEIGWKDNILLFNGKSLKYIFKVLSRTYGVKFIVADNNYADRRITANFDHASLSTVIKSIKKLTNLKSHIEKDENREVIVFY